MRALTIALTLLVASAAFAQRDWSKVEVKATKVAGSVYMLTGAGGNIGLSVGDDGVVMIDDQFAPIAPKVEAAMKSITDKPLRFILNTHYHGDHTGGNEIFGKSAPIIAHENVRKRLAAGTTRRGTTTPPAAPGALPVLTFNDTLTVHINGEDVRAVHVPHGHTDGDVVIWFTKSNVIHMGDDFFSGLFPVMDLDNGGSVRGLIADLDRLLPTIPDDAKLIPGHGPLSDKTGLRNFATMLKGTLAVVESGLKAGKTAQQLKDEKALAEWDAWAKGSIKSDDWIDTLVREVNGK